MEINNYLIRITCLFWIIAKAFTWKLWLSDRLFPVVPAFDFLYEVPSFVHLFFFFISVLCLIGLLIKPASQKLLIIFFFFELFSCLLDQNRWQPWEYQYLFIIFTFIINKGRTHFILPAIALILSCTYFYSGISKLNPFFIEKVWSRMFLLRFIKISKPLADQPFVYYAGYFIPLIETTCGFCLLFLKTQKTAAYLLILMHVLNLLFLGPLGLNYNSAVWPWNVAMIFYLQSIFLSINKFSYKPLRAVSNFPVIMCWGILPAFNLIGLWDNYLSSNLYSGKTENVIICIYRKADKYPEELKPYFSLTDKRHTCNGGKLISLTAWSMKELKAPCYPERRIFNRVKDIVGKKYSAYNIHFFITGSDVNAINKY